ncbi:L,D-transpeptidase family protein [Solirubrobacter soli]|uniref:L,D-transpeptidase family protein n=1 Tax=Solirubrobacter soli TaxID=363832 RepID=UPI000406D645|nr:L,D-transpeptidase [Solirubrobacter soli]
MALGLAPAPAARKRRPHRRRRWPVVAVFAVIAVVALALTAVLELSGLTLSPDPQALAGYEIQLFGGGLVRAHGTDPEGRPVALTGAGEKLTPRNRIAPGTKVTVVVTIRRPGWNAWLLGKTATKRITVMAPLAKVTSTWVTKPAGGAVPVTFSEPVARVSYAGHTARGTGPSLKLPEKARAGTVRVAVAARPWEKLGDPVTVHYFPPAKRPVALVNPAPGGRLDPGDQVRVTFSAKAAQPKVSVAGRWKHPDGHTYVFTPSGSGPSLGSDVKLTLPHTAAVADSAGRGLKTGRTVTWKIPPASPLRLIQLLADEGYLPVKFDGPAVAQTVRAQQSAAADPPKGDFPWRFDNTPSELKKQWKPETGNVIVSGAIMMFQDEHHLTVDGLPGPDLWKALLADAVDGKTSHTGGYNYVFVHRDSRPQVAHLWHNGKEIFSSPGNTGVAAAPTDLGTFPVFEHLAETTMSGTNPDGSHYSDPGIKWVSYFNGGDALHAFDRASFGTPQSVGCVELPLAAAAKIYPYTPIGTLVTIES